jgi:RNA-dependent RNA polymerase
MEFDLYGVHTEASVWDVKKAVAQVLHENPGPDFFGYGGLPEQPRKLNFKVELGKGPGGVRNNGRGVLTVPSKKVGKLLSDWTRSPGNAIVVLGRRMRLAHTSRVPRPDHKMMLEQGPYVDPDTEEYQQQKFDALHRSLLVDEIQFGILRPPRGPKRGPRTFAIEFSEKYEQRRAQLTIEWKYKQIRLDVSRVVYSPRAGRDSSFAAW